MNSKNTKNNILHKIMVLLAVFSLTVIDTVPLWVNARDVTKEEEIELEEELVEEELVEEELVEEELVEEELVEEELVEEELVEEELVEEELVEEELVEEELVEEELTKTDKETNIGRGLLTSTFGTKVKSNLTNTNEVMIARTMSTTSNYVLARDSDFSGTSNGNFRYIGTAEYVEIPRVIKGVNVTSYSNMFEGTSVKGVKSTNKNVTNMSNMFKDSKATSLDLSNFDTSRVLDMEGMFNSSQATSLDLSSFDTRSVTNMRSMFFNSKATSLDLSSFDTSSVTNMRTMFYESQATSIDVSSFDTSSVTEMTGMFMMSKVTSIDLSSFDTSRVTSMNAMFYKSQATSIDVSSFDTSDVTDMGNMFYETQTTSLDLSSFDTSNVTDMSYMFNRTKATILDLSSFDTSKVTNTTYMFSGSQVTIGYARTQADANRLNGSGSMPSGLTFNAKYVLARDSDFSGTSNGNFTYTGTDEYVEIPHRIKGVNVTSYNDMFRGTSVKGVASTNKNVTGMNGMFYESQATSLDVSNIDTSSVTDMSYMFNKSKATRLDLSNFDTSKVTSMYAMFNGSQATSIDLSSFDTSNVTSMRSMFNTSKATRLDLSSFDTSKVTNMVQMFYLSEATSLDLSSFDTSSVTDMSIMFNDSRATSLDLSNFDTSSVTNMFAMFYNSKATSLDLSSFDTSRVTNMQAMFYGSQATSLDLSSFDTSRVSNMGIMFQNSQATIGYARTKADADRFNGSSNKPSGLTFIVMTPELREFEEWVKTLPSHYTVATDSDFSGTSNGNFSYIGTDEYVVIPPVIKGVNVTSYFNMFTGTSVKGVASTNKNVTSMQFMFSGTQATSLDLSNLDTSSVTDMGIMFFDSKASSIDLSNFDTRNVTTMNGMFYGSQATSLDLSSFDTSSVTDMTGMFFKSQATSIDVSSFDTSSATAMVNMFRETQETSLDLRHFDTSSVTDMRSMFNSSQATSIDLSSFDTSSVTDMNLMFHNSQATSLDLSSFDTGSVTNMDAMFLESKATIGYARTKDDADRFNGSSDKPTSLTFYFYEEDAPTGTITGNPTTWTNQNVTLRFNATDDNGVKRVQRPDGTWVNGSSTTHTVTTNGAYTFKAEDNLGNTGTYSVTVNRIDKTLPTVTFGTNGNSTPRKTHSTTVNVADSGGSGVATRQYQWTTSTATPTSGTWTSFTNGTTLTRSTGTGNIYLHIRATDNAGNVRNSRSNAFNMDNTAPTTPTLTANTTAWTNGDVTVTINYPTDANIKEYRVGSGAWETYTSTVTLTSNNTIFARAFDLAGNESSTSSLQITNIDKVAPVLNITGNPTDWDERDEITLSVVTSDTLSGVRRITLPDNKVVTSSNATYKVEENGDYVFKVEDNAGNITTRTVTVDKLMVHYYLYLRDSRGNPVKDSTFELLRDGKVYRTSTTDDKGYLDFGKVPPVGKYTLKQVTNSEGIEIKDPVEIDQDVSDPIEEDTPIEIPIGETLKEPTININPNVWTNKDVTVTITNSEDSTIKQYKINDGEWEEYTQPISLAENSKVYARTYDDIGNWSPETSLEVTVIDKVNPKVEIEINTEDWVGDRVELTVIAKDEGSGVDVITSNQDLERISQDTQGDTVRSVYLVKGNGYYEFTVRDIAGNMVTETYTVNNIDKTEPEITVNGNPVDWFRDYELELEVITSDNHSGIKQVTLPDGTVVTGQDLDKLTYKVTDNGSYEFIIEDIVGNKTTYTEEVTMLEKEFSVKVTDTGNKPLTGAEFELYRDGELIETVVSDNSGLVAFGTVYTSGDYEIRQTRVPEGYRLNNNIMEVDVADDDINITNYHQSEELPSTGTMETLIMLVMGLASITVITVTNKKRRKLRKEV